MFQKTPALFNIQTRCYSGIHVHYEVNEAIKRFVESKVKDSWKLRKALMSEQMNSTLKLSVFPPCLWHFQTFGSWKSNHTKMLADTQSSQFSCSWTQLHTTENRADHFLLQLRSTKWLFDTSDIRADEMQKQRVLNWKACQYFGSVIIPLEEWQFWGMGMLCGAPYHPGWCSPQWEAFGKQQGLLQTWRIACIWY